MSDATSEDRGLPYSPYGLAYVDGGLSQAAPRPPPSLGLDLLTVSPVSGPRGLMREGGAARGDASPGDASHHWHWCPADDSWGLPIAPSLAGMQCYLSVANLRALSASVGASEGELRRWYQLGEADAQCFFERHPTPSSTRAQ